MLYHDGSCVRLGDIVLVPVPGGWQQARVVMLGESYEHLDIEPGFVQWVIEKEVLDRKKVVVEWTGTNPFAHSNPEYAPVGNYVSAR